MHNTFVQCIISVSAFASFVPMIFPSICLKPFAYISNSFLLISQIALLPMIALWLYTRILTWPTQPPLVWKKYAFKLLSFSSGFLIAGCLYAKFSSTFFSPVVTDPYPVPPVKIPYLTYLYTLSCLLGTAIGFYHRSKKTPSLPLINLAKSGTHALLYPVSIFTVFSILTIALTDHASLFSSNTWEAIACTFYISIIYTAITILSCKKLTSLTFQNLFFILLYPLFQTRGFFLPPTSHSIEYYLPQARNTSLLLHYNFTMECLGVPCAIIPLLLCETYTPSLYTILYGTILLILPRLFLPIQPLLSHTIGSLLLCTLDIPIPYISLSVWVMSLADIMINVPQIFTSYISLTIFLPPQERIGKPIKLFTNY